MNGSAGRSGTWGSSLVALVVAAFAMGGVAAPAASLDQRCLEEVAKADVANTLERRAEALIEEGAGWRLAGELMLEAARLRPECAPERLAALQTAARYFRFGGDFERASDASFEAGENGVWNGHVTTAAEAFIDAATYALEVGDRHRVRTAAGHASRLAGSPHLTHIQRIRIRGRAERLLERGGPLDHRRPVPRGGLGTRT